MEDKIVVEEIREAKSAVADAKRDLAKRLKETHVAPAGREKTSNDTGSLTLKELARPRAPRKARDAEPRTTQRG
jgi:hypothetical protein